MENVKREIGYWGYEMNLFIVYPIHLIYPIFYKPFRRFNTLKITP
jgi:hypothetical protein